MKLLHIVASPRGAQSRTLMIAHSFLEELRAKHKDLQEDCIDLFQDTLPSLTLQGVDGKYQLMSGKEVEGESKKAWQPIEDHIKRFLSADLYLISAPMWNFGVPYPLKQYIDLIVQPKRLYQYTDKGPEGLAKNKKMVVVSARGGDYSHEPQKAMDFHQPYLKGLFGFVGIQDIQFVNAEPMDSGGAKDEKLNKAKEEAKKIAATL